MWVRKYWLGPLVKAGKIKLMPPRLGAESPIIQHYTLSNSYALRKIVRPCVAHTKAPTRHVFKLMFWCNRRPVVMQHLTIPLTLAALHEQVKPFKPASHPAR
jgi:hypothetical protein